MTGLTFVLQDLETGRVVAHALLCPEARYAGLLRYEDSTIARPSGSPFQWLCVEEQLSRRIDDGPLHRNSAIVALLLDEDRRSSIVIQHLVSTPLVPTPPDAAAALDAQLREFGRQSLTA